MATVRSYTRQIEPAALPNVRQTPERIPQVDAPLLRVNPDTGAEKLGNTIAKVGEAFYGESQLQSAEDRLARQKAAALAKKQADEERVSVAERDFRSGAITWIEDPQVGAKAKYQKNDAIGLPDEWRKFSNDLYDRISAGLNPDQRMAFAQKIRPAQDSYDLDIARYTTQETGKAQLENHNALVDLDIQDAIRGAHDTATVMKASASANTEIERYQSSHGGTENTTKDAQAKAQSTLWEGVIRKLMADSQDPANADPLTLSLAKSYFETFGDRILGEKRNELQTKLNVTANESAATQYAIAAFQDNGPKSDKDPLEMDKILAPLQKKFAVSNPPLYAAIKTQVESLAKTFKESAKAREDFRDGTTQKAVIDGATMPQLLAMPEFQMLPPDKQYARKQQLLTRNKEFEALARSTEAYFRTRAREARAEEREIEREKKAAATEKANALYHDLGSDPQALIKMTEPELYTWGEKIGKENLNSLLKMRRDLIESKPKVDLNMLYQAANGHGFTPYPEPGQPLTEQEKADLGALEKYVRDRFDAEPIKPGEKMPRERQQQIIDKAVIEIVTEYGYLGTTMGQKTKPEALITIQDISPAEQLRLKARIALDKTQRGKSPAVSDQDIIDLFIAEREAAQGAR